jgi:iron complex outermembrane recepter protein
LTESFSCIFDGVHSCRLSMKHIVHSVLLLGLFIASLSASAQSGQISGVVKDPHQAVVVGAKITLTGAPLAEAKKSTTNGQGEYIFTGLSVGEYKIEIYSPGFKPVQIGDIKVSGAGETVQSATLVLAGSSDSVEVNSMALDLNVQTQPQAALLDVPEGVGGDTIEFTAKDIAALHPASLLDVLQQVPGLAVSFQGRQHMDFASMRGGSFLVVLDGVYMSQTDRILSMLPTQLVESMTVVHDSTALSIGPLSTALGGTMGGSGTGVANQGFIIIRTKRAAKTDVGIVSSGGSFGTALGHAYAGSKIGNWDYRGAYTYYNTEGKDKWNMQARNGSATFHGGYTSNALTMDFMYYGSRGMRNMEYGEVLSSATFSSCTPKATQVGALCPTTMNIYKNDGDLYAFNVARHWNDKNRTVLQYGFDRLIINAGTSATHTAIASNEQDSTQANLVLKHTYVLKGNAITGGGQFTKYIAPLGSAPTSGAVTNRVDQAMASWFVQDEYHMLGNRLVLDGGIRGDKTHNKNYNSTLKTTSDVWGSTFKTLAFGASYKVNPKVTTTARYGLVTTLPASNLVTQTSSGLSSSLPNQTQNRGELSTNVVLDSHFKPTVSIYIYDTSNGTASASNCINPSTGTKASSWENASGNEIDCVSLVGEVMTAGTEVGFSGKLVGPLSYNAGYGYVSTDNTASNKTMSHNFMNAGLEYRQKNWFAKYSMVYVGPLWSSSSPGGTYYGELANYTRSDVNGGYNFKMFEKQQMTITAYGRNLNDNNYATRYVTGAYRDPGRQFGIELAARIF